MGPSALSHTSDPDEMLLLDEGWGSDRGEPGGERGGGNFFYFFLLRFNRNILYFTVE